MKKIIATISLAACANLAHAEFNEDAYLAANPDVKAAGLTALQHVSAISVPELSARLAAMQSLIDKTNMASDVKIMFCDLGSATFTESSTIQPQDLWYVGSTTGKTTAKAMIQAGWKIQNTFSLNTKQYFIVFVK